jgi:hypothetical protein
MAVALAVTVNHFEGPFFDVEGFKGFRSIPSSIDSIRLVFLTLSLRQYEPTGLPDKERVMVCRFFPVVSSLAVFLPVIGMHNQIAFSARLTKRPLLFKFFNVEIGPTGILRSEH